MLLPTSTAWNAGPVTLSTGEHLPEQVIAYETWGALNAARDNAILLCHGYTNHPHAGAPGGWMANLLGPGLAVDTDRWFVVCANMMGSSYGSSGPQQVNPETGRPYGPDFPAFTTEDMLRAQERLLEHLGIGQLHAVMGYSYGGHLTYLWGATRPDRMRRLVPIAGFIERETPPEVIAGIRAPFEACAGWNGGHYHATPDAVHAELVRARTQRLTMYGMGDYLADTVDDPAERTARLHQMAEDWADQFDANSLWILAQARAHSSGVAQAHRMQAPLLSVMADTDTVVTIGLGQPTVDMLKGHGVDARLITLRTKYGHAGPMIDAHLWANDLRAFLDGV